MATAGLEALLGVQELDTALDQLRHRRETLVEREQLAAIVGQRAGAAAAVAEITETRDTVLREEKRLDDEAQTVAAKMKDVDATLYGGGVTSPRELQALQADLDSLKAHRTQLEDQELEVMEQRETLDATVAEREGELGALVAEGDALVAAIRAAEAAIDAEIADDEQNRIARAAVVDATLLADYEHRRARNRGIGIARLIGPTCQGCRLGIPATELDEIRRAPEAQIYSCDNCGSILVPTDAAESNE